MAPPNNKMDALKIVATFLDFSEDDRVKLGMQKGHKKAGPQVYTKKFSQIQVNESFFQESLTEAFVRFLEKESKVVAPSPIHRVVKEQFKVKLILYLCSDCYNWLLGSRNHKQCLPK
jgi:hypothetical protein